MLIKTNTYIPISGSPAAKAIACFKKSPGKELSSGDLAKIMGVKTNAVASTLGRAIRAGAVSIRRIGRVGYYSLGCQTSSKVHLNRFNTATAQDVAEQPFSIALYSTGELLICGAAVNRGVATLSAAQAAELHKYLLHTGSLIEQLQSQANH